MCFATPRVSISDKCEIITDVNARFEKIKNTNLCFNCLGSNHRKRDCKKKIRCHICKGNHNTALCMRNNNEQEKHSLAVNNENYVLLQTAKVYIADVKEIKEVAVKIIFDSCSQQTYVTQKVYICCMRSQLVF